MRQEHDGTRHRSRMRHTAAGMVSAMAVAALLAPSLSGTGQETDLADARSIFESARTWGEIESLFARDSMAASVLPREWSKLIPHQQNQLREALAGAARGWVRAHLGEDGLGMEDLAWRSGEVDEGRVTLSYRVGSGPESGRSLTVEMVREDRGEWRILDLVREKRGMIEEHRTRAEKALKDYSFAYMLADLQEADEVVLEDFEAGPVGGLPEGWSWKGSDDKKEKPYTVVEEGGNRFLQARDSGQSVILGKDIPWDLEKYPYVSFRLRVHRIPDGGDERNDKTVDSAAGLYFTYRRRLGMIPESVKYVWSSTLPVGAAVIRPGTGRPWQVVVGSGTDGLGEWRTYVFDLRQAYRDTFGKNPPDKTAGIGVLSDANSTKSHAWADYDDIKALRSVDPPVGSGVMQIMKHTR